MILRRLNETGLRAFRGFIERSFTGGAVEPVPESLLSLEPTSESLSADIDLDPLPSKITAYDLAKYLNAQFGSLSIEEIEGSEGRGDVGFWAAVALNYFDLLTPGFRRGEAKAKTVNRYIPEIDSELAAMRYYRHLIAGPWRLCRNFGEASRPLLLSPACEASALYSKITDSAFYSQTPCIVEVINLLYFDAACGRLKRDYNATDKPGTLPRLLKVVDQLDLTFDLLAIDGLTLLARLPAEFDSWSLPRSS